MLELINRARMNPTQEGVLLDAVNTAYSRDARARKPSFFSNLRGEFTAYPAVPPLAFNHKLIQSSRAHSQDMLTRNFFAHVNPSGQDPTARGAAVGYDKGVGENISGAGATSGDEVLQSHFGFMVDYDNIDTSHPLGHRLNVLDASYSEAGVGIAGSYVPGKVTQDFGAPARAYILGVAYSDTNGNGAYDPGEGRSGIAVRPDMGNYFAVTSASGGFAIPIDPVQTVTDTVNLPFAVRGGSFSAVQPYDEAYRRQQMQAAPNLTVNLTWSSGGLTTPITTATTIKRPIQLNYRLMGTDGWYYTMSMVTTQNVKADLTALTGPTPPPSPRSIRDLDGDGISDLLFQNSSGQVLTWQMNGTGGVKSGAWVFPDGLGDWKLVGMLDVSGDGVPDLVLQNPAGLLLARLIDGQGSGYGWKWISSTGLGDWKAVGIADINGDSNPDIIFQNTKGQILARLTDAQGGVIAWQWISSSALGDWKVVGLADVNADNVADIIVQNTAGLILALKMDATGRGIAWQWIYAGSLGDWKLSATIDLNSDGKADLVFQNSVGSITGWLMNGAGSATGTVQIFSGSLGGWRVR